MITNQRKLRRSIRNNYKKRNFLIDVVLFSLNFTQNPTATNPKIIKTESQTKLQIQRLQQQIQKDQIQIQTLKSGLKNDPEENDNKNKNNCPDYLKIDNCVNNDLTFIKCSWKIDQLSQSCVEKNNYRLYDRIPIRIKCYCQQAYVCSTKKIIMQLHMLLVFFQ